MLNGDALVQYEAINEKGMVAKDAGNHGLALDAFVQAEKIAQENDDPHKILDAQQPTARALWSLGRYGEATDKLEAAFDLATKEGLTDEQGIITSNMGRIAAVKTVRTIPVNDQKNVLSTEAVPKFKKAHSILKAHPHLYYRYANAQHGSIVAALAGERRLTISLIAEAIRVATRTSASPYDQEQTYRISTGTRRGILQMVIATTLIPFGDKTPALAKVAREKLVR